MKIIGNIRKYKGGGWGGGGVSYMSFLMLSYDFRIFSYEHMGQITQIN